MRMPVFPQKAQRRRGGEGAPFVRITPEKFVTCAVLERAQGGSGEVLYGLK